MKHCSVSHEVIRFKTGIEMVPKSKTTSSQRQKACAIVAHSSQSFETSNYRKGLRKRSNNKRKKHHESLHHVLSPPYLNYISPVYLTGYTFFSGGGAIGNPPINILNLPTGDKNLKVLSINNGDLHAPNIHLQDSTKGITQIQPGGGMTPLILVPREDALLSTGMHTNKSRNTTVCNALDYIKWDTRTTMMRGPH